MKPAKSGDSIREHLTTQWFNKTIKKPSKASTPGLSTSGIDNIVLPCICEATKTADAFKAVKILGSWLEHETGTVEDVRVGDVGVLVERDPINSDLWGVVSSYVDEETSSEVTVGGAVWAEITYSNTDHIYVTLLNGELVSSDIGNTRIIEPPVGDLPATGKALILLRTGQDDRRFFKLVEDASGVYGPAWARKTNRTGGDEGELFQLYWFDSILNGAQAGYKGTFEEISGESVLETGACPITCETAGYFSEYPAATGTVNTEYTDSMGVDGTTDNMNVSGLPPGLEMDTDGNITGTPTTAGTYYPIFTVTADKTGSLTGEKCTLTQMFEMTIAEE